MNTFPPAEDDGCAPYRKVAHYLECNIDDVFNAWAGVPVPEWDLPIHLSLVKETSHALNTASRYSQNLVRALKALSQQERDDLISSGCITVFQIEYLSEVLSGNAENLSDWLKGKDRRGGRNPAAYAVGEGMRRLFRRLRRKITYGVSPSGDPSTEFCRAVEYGLGAFGILADFRGPASAAHDTQERILGRYARISYACQTRLMQTR